MMDPAVTYSDAEFSWELPEIQTALGPDDAVDIECPRCRCPRLVRVSGAEAYEQLIARLGSG